MKTIDKEFDYTIEVKASKFICCLRKVETKEDVNKKMLEIKKDYPKAKHYPYAYIIDNDKKCTDDKEPSNTAGLPLLNIIEKLGLNNVLVVVVRYFGGTLLGAGLLTRTYARSANEALDKIKIVDLILYQGFLLTFNYDKEKDVNYLLKDEIIYKKDFKEMITYEVYIKKEHEKDLITKLNSMENIVIQNNGTKYFEV